MIEKNHSQRNIYLYDLKNNKNQYQSTASMNRSGVFASLLFLIIASILIVTTYVNKPHQINPAISTTLDSINRLDSQDSVIANRQKVYSMSINTTEPQRSDYSVEPTVPHRLSFQENDSIAEARIALSRATTEQYASGYDVNQHTAAQERFIDERYYPLENAQIKQQAPQYNLITVSIKKGDSLSKIFNRLGLPHSDAIALASVNNMKSLNYLNVGEMLEIKTTPDNKFSGLKYRINRIKTIEINRNEAGELISTTEELEPKTRIRDVTAPIQGNLFSTADNLNISSRVISKLSAIFRWDIDFARDIKEGDRFSLIYEEQYINNELVLTGDIVAAEFIINGSVTRAIRHKDEDGNAHYYTPEGKSLRKAFLRNPIRFAKVTSGFTKRRYHPVLKKWRAHKGVDYAAPKGTPIMATADGVISHIGRKGAYGKAIVINHGKSYSSLYGHMKGFKKDLKNGARVKQGQIIGYVGSTGLATGPHLHYEFRIDGKHVDPLAVDLPKALPIDSEELNEFIAASEKWIRRLDALQGQPIARVEAQSQPSS